MLEGRRWLHWYFFIVFLHKIAACVWTSHLFWMYVLEAKTICCYKDWLCKQPSETSNGTWFYVYTRLQHFVLCEHRKFPMHIAKAALQLCFNIALVSYVPNTMSDVPKWLEPVLPKIKCDAVLDCFLFLCLTVFVLSAWSLKALPC